MTYDTVVTSNRAYRIANDWLQGGISTGVQALEYVKKRKADILKKKNRQSYRQNNRVEKGTDWSKKKAKNEGMSTEQLKDIFKDLKNK